MSKNPSSAKVKVIAALLLCFVIALLMASASPYTIDGDTVYIDNENVYISMTPHTVYGEGWVYSNFIFKTYTGNVDVAYGFNTSATSPTACELYDPHTVHYNTSHRAWFYNVSSAVSTPTAAIDYGNTYNTHRYTITYQRCTQHNETTLTCD